MNDTRDIELNAIGVLKRREIEARLLAPLIEGLSREFGRERALQTVRETIVGIARDRGLRELHVDDRGRGSAMFGHPSQHQHMMEGVAAAVKYRKTPKHLKPHLKNRLAPSV